jgi:hypothetical protein
MIVKVELYIAEKHDLSDPDPKKVMEAVQGAMNAACSELESDFFVSYAIK